MNSSPTRRNEKPLKKSASRSMPPEPQNDRGLKIGEAAKVIGVEPYVLRFWETQFAILKPRHARSRHRFYQPRDIETLKLIKRLLHHEGFTIVGANKYIRENGIDPANIAAAQAEEKTAAPRAEKDRVLDSSTKKKLAEMRRDLESIQKLLG